MKLLIFLLGLGTGLALLEWYHTWLDRRLKIRHREAGKQVPLPFWIFRTWFMFPSEWQCRAEGQADQCLKSDPVAWEKVLRCAPLGYLQVDEENQLIWCNQEAQRLLGIEQWDPSRPRLLLELVRSYELDHLIEQTRESQQPCQSEWTLHSVNPDPANPLQCPPYPLRGCGLPLMQGEIGVFLENRQEVVNLTQQRDRWASDVAHELKTPLTSIRLVAETLQSRLSPPLQDWVDRLLSEVIRLSYLVQDLLDMSQLEKGSLYSLRIQTLDLAELVQSAWLNLEPLARRQNLRLNYVGPAPFLLQADESRLYRVFMNLLDNSIKHSPPNQEIVVRARIVERISAGRETPGQQVHIEVIDSGSGFPEGALPHIFERFYQADVARSRHPLTNVEGMRQTQINTVLEAKHQAEPACSSRAPGRSSSGLGLAIVRQIIEAHQGSVSASNHPETGGAWLQIFLPHHLPESASVG